MAFIGIEGKFGVEIPMPRLRLPGLGQLRIWKRERDEARHLRLAAERLEALSPHLLADAGIEYGHAETRD